MNIYCSDTNEEVKSYKDYLKTKHWLRFKKTAMVQQKGCSVCNAVSNLCLHHKTYTTVGNESLTDVVVLCHKCHELLHRYIGIIDKNLSAETDQFINLMKLNGNKQITLTSKYKAGRARQKTGPLPKVKKEPRNPCVPQSWVPINNGVDL